MILLFISAFLIFGIQAEKSSFFRKDYTYNPDFASFYKLHTVHRSWLDAKTRCQREGAQFFYPETQAEVEAAIALMNLNLPNYDHTWLAISDLVSEGDFQTVDGKSLEDIYINWASGEPNDHDGKEDCVTLFKSGQMNDDQCTLKLPFICKKTLSSLEWNALCDMPDSSYVYNFELGKCYKFHLKPLNWTEAYSVCSAEQSYLTVINSQKEADYLTKMTADAPKDQFKGYYLSGAVHIGFHNQFKEGYTTVTGVPLEDSGYIRWGGGQPDGKDTELCGSMFYEGTLNDMWCGSICFFICEHDIGALSASVDDRIGSK